VRLGLVAAKASKATWTLIWTINQKVPL
jgi:hypothetical protein